MRVRPGGLPVDRSQTPPSRMRAFAKFFAPPCLTQHYLKPAQSPSILKIPTIRVVLSSGNLDLLNCGFLRPMSSLRRWKLRRALAEGMAQPPLCSGGILSSNVMDPVQHDTNSQCLRNYGTSGLYIARGDTWLLLKRIQDSNMRLQN